MDIHASASRNFPNEFVFHLAPVRSHGIVASLSDHSLRVLPLDQEKFGTGPIIDYKGIHSGPITGLQTIDGHCAATSSIDGTVKVWDFRVNSKHASQVFQNGDLDTPLTCLDVHQGKVAAGTELKEQDAGVLLWDMRTTNKPIVAYMDSHNEDVTQVQFHRDEANGLMSAGQDGYVQVYNTSILDMDEAIYQTINHGSAIQRAGFLPNRHVFAKSNMETMAIYKIPDPDSEEVDPEPRDFGDLRTKWHCEYVADLVEGYVALGTNSEHKFGIMAWEPETDTVGKAINLVGAHGEEVVRAIHLDAFTQCIYTGGEDGCVKVWKPSEPLDISTGEWQQVKSKKAKKDKSKKKKDKKSKKRRYEPY